MTTPTRDPHPPSPPSTDAVVTVTDLDTPVGPIRVAVRAPGTLVALAFADHFDRVAAPVRAAHRGPWTDDARGEVNDPVVAAVARYLDGDLDALDTIDVDVPGTGFRRSVWTALRTIPAGSTWSYAQLAAAVGSPGATRAVGSANGANPVWLVVPCHRVVRSDGSLGGYGGGVDRKAWLLAHEGAAIARER